MHEDKVSEVKCNRIEKPENIWYVIDNMSK